MSLLMDALRRAEADKKLQEERAARAASGEASPDSGLITRISPYSNAQDDTVQIDGRALQAAAASIADFDLRIDDNLDHSMPMTIAEELSLEPLDGREAAAERSDDDLDSATTFAGGDTFGAGDTHHGRRFERPEQTGTLPSSRGMQNDLDDYFDRSQVMEAPRATSRGSDGTLEDVASHTVVGAQTVFRAGERPRGGRILALGAAIAACAVVAIAAVGVYYAGLNPTPRVMPSPGVASGVEKPLPHDRPMVTTDAPVAASENQLPRIDTQAAVTESGAAPVTSPAATMSAALDEKTAATPATPPAEESPGPAAVARPVAGRAVVHAQKVARPASDGLRMGALKEESTPGEVQISRSHAPNALDATLSKAYAAFQRGDLDAAGTLYTNARVVDPERRDTLLGLAAVASKRGDLPRAYAYYVAVLKRYPDDPIASAAVLGMSDTQGEAGAARLRLLLDSHRDAAYLHAALGRWYARHGRWADAQQAYFDAARLDAGNPDYVFNLAVALDHMGQVTAAIDHYHSSLKLHEQRSAGFSTAAAQDRIRALSASDAP